MKNLSTNSSVIESRFPGFASLMPGKNSSNKVNLLPSGGGSLGDEFDGSLESVNTSPKQQIQGLAQC